MAAAEDLEAIARYLHQHNPEFAESTLKRLYEAAKVLKRFPKMGRIGIKSGTRELILNPLPYILVYSEDEESIQILRFLHGAQNRT